MDNYRTVKIPINLFYSIQEIILLFKELDFNTPTEFVKDAIRRRIEEFISLNPSYRKNKGKKDSISDFNFI